MAPLTRRKIRQELKKHQKLNKNGGITGDSTDKNPRQHNGLQVGVSNLERQLAKKRIQQHGPNSGKRYYHCRCLNYISAYNIVGPVTRSQRRRHPEILLMGPQSY